jgi:hypothetical protein
MANRRLSRWQPHKARAGSPHEQMNIPMSSHDNPSGFQHELHLVSSEVAYVRAS